MEQDDIAKQYRRPTGTMGKSMGKIFDSANKRQNDWVISLLKIKPTDYVLEIGFGTGRSIERIAKLIKDGMIAGIDFSNVMVEVASERNAKAIEDSLVDLRLGDTKILPYPNSFFNKVFAVYVIYFWPKPIKALKEIRRVMKVGGTVAIYLSTKKTLSKIPFTQTGVFRSYTQKELENMFRKAGFKNIVCKAKSFDGEGGICVMANK